MNRKLHNTLMALIASSSLFVLGLLTAAPAFSPVAGAALAAGPAAEGSRVEARAEAAGTPRRHVRRSRQQSVAMPFFSFAPRG